MNGQPTLRAATAVVLCSAAVLSCAASGQQTADKRGAPAVQGFTVVQSYPHDPAAFTQGLVFADGEFYESTGLYGESSVRRVEIATGKVLQSTPVDKQYFAEGLALVGDALLQLTWQHQLGFVYDRKTMAPRTTFTYKTEGWGLAYDAKGGLVLSDGSESIFFLDPKNQAVVRTVRVTDAGRPVPQLNELEWIEGEIWANVWQTDRIARIDPKTGAVNAWVDLTLLWPRARRAPPADVLNGIAYDPVGKRIFVTGKKWPRVYEIKIQ
jgi:glutaminyl-peptide cyclotransferase